MTPRTNQNAAKTINADLPVLVYEGVLDTVDCAHLVFTAAPLLERAAVINPSSDLGGMVSDIRTNSATYLYAGRLDIISRYIELKIVRTVGEELDRSEPLSVLRYAPGEYYKPHVDFFNPRLNVSKGLLNDGGQRTGSAVTCLVTPDAGGGTSFPRLGVEVPAKAGNTVWFRNCDAAGNPDERSLHAGEAVERGEKWVVTKWFREQNTTYASPVLDVVTTDRGE
jgi:prolyl 4-hydroxylase